jgi:hypothetical protein
MTPPEQRRNEVFVDVTAAKSTKSGPQAGCEGPA